MYLFSMTDSCLSRGVCVGHGFGGIPIEWDIPIEVFGTTVQPGQLIHADKHGFLVVPEEDEARLLEATEFMDFIEVKHAIQLENAIIKNQILTKQNALCFNTKVSKIQNKIL